MSHKDWKRVRTKVNSIDMTSYGNVAMNRLKFGTVLFAHVPYKENAQETKTRPCIVLHTSGKHAVVLPLYSNSGMKRTAIAYRGRRSYIEFLPIVIHQYDFVNVDPEPLDEEILETVKQTLDGEYFLDVDSDSLLKKDS